MSRLVGSTLVVIAAACFGFMGLFGAWARDAGLSVEMMLFLRFAIAGVLMTLIMWCRRLPWPRGWTLLGLIGMGGVLYVGEAMFYFHAARHIPVGMVSLLLYAYPVIVTLFAWLALKEPLTPARLVALCLAVTGLALTIGPIAARAANEAESSAVDQGRDPTLGVILGMCCCISYAIYILCGPPLTRRAGAVPAATVVILAAAGVLGILAIAQGKPLPPGMWPWGVGGVAGLALFSTVIAITAVLAGLERIGAVQTSTLSTLEPVMTVLVGAAFLHESLAWAQIIGGGLIVIAAIVIARGGSSSVPSERSEPISPAKDGVSSNPVESSA